MLDLEVSTRTPAVQPSALAQRPAPGSGAGQRTQSLNFSAPHPALSGRVIGVNAPASDTPVIVMIAVAVLMTVSAGVTASFLAAGSRGESAKLTTEVTALQQQLRTGPIAEKLKRQQTVFKQLSALTGFLADATPWPTVLDSLSALVPTGTKLTTINIDAEKTVRLEGETGNQEEVSTFMAALDASTDFATPRLDSLSLSESVDGSAVLFSIATRYAPEKVVVSPSPLSSPPLATPSLSAPSSLGPDAGSNATPPAAEAVGPDAEPIAPTETGGPQ